MENTKIVFCSEDESNSELQAYINNNGKIYIEIIMDNQLIPNWITLNRLTAIKLVKHLKREISYMEEK